MMMTITTRTITMFTVVVIVIMKNLHIKGSY